jgi:glycine cleavage system H protein
MCPLSGSILEVNTEAQLNPSLVEKDPYFRGWLYRILPSNPASDLQWLNL